MSRSWTCLIFLHGSHVADCPSLVGTFSWYFFSGCLDVIQAHGCRPKIEWLGFLPPEHFDATHIHQALPCCLWLCLFWKLLRCRHAGVLPHPQQCVASQGVPTKNISGNGESGKIWPKNTNRNMGTSRCAFLDVFRFVTCALQGSGGMLGK